MARRIQSVYMDHSVKVLLMCGCRRLVSITAVFEVKEFDCVWHPEHGKQPWLRFDACSSGYVVECKRRGCSVKRKDYSDGLLTAGAFARSHSRIHGHEVWLLVDDWVAKKIVPEVLDVESIPF